LRRPFQVKQGGLERNSSVELHVSAADGRAGDLCGLVLADSVVAWLPKAGMVQDIDRIAANLQLDTLLTPDIEGSRTFIGTAGNKIVDCYPRGHLPWGIWRRVICLNGFSNRANHIGRKYVAVAVLLSKGFADDAGAGYCERSVRVLRARVSIAAGWLNRLRSWIVERGQACTGEVSILQRIARHGVERSGRSTVIDGLVEVEIKEHLVAVNRAADSEAES
jgi:hypothetical protein